MTNREFIACAFDINVIAQGLFGDRTIDLDAPFDIKTIIHVADADTIETLQALALLLQTFQPHDA